MFSALKSTNKSDLLGLQYSCHIFETLSTLLHMVIFSEQQYHTWDLYSIDNSWRMY